MIRPTSDRDLPLAYADIAQRNGRPTTSPLEEETLLSRFRSAAENTETGDEKSKPKAALNNAQRYMANNAKALATASMMLESDEEEEDEEEARVGWGQGKKNAMKAGKSGGDNEAARISFGDAPKERKSQPESEAGGTETEVIEQADGSKIMLVKMKISEGTYTTVKIKISSGKPGDADALQTTPDGMPIGAPQPPDPSIS